MTFDFPFKHACIRNEIRIFGRIFENFRCSRYLIDTNLSQYADDHWIPFYLYCTPCLLHYNVIAKVETMDQDQLYVIRLLGLQDRIRPRWRHKTQFMTGGFQKGVVNLRTNLTLSMEVKLQITET